MRYIHSKPFTKSKSHRGLSSVSLERKIKSLRPRIRVAAEFITRERIYSAEFPNFGAPQGSQYDGTGISKTNRNPVAKA
jgi:hypothetical protein